MLASCDDPNKYQPPPAAEVGVLKPQQRRVTLYLELTGNTSAFNKVDLVARVQILWGERRGACIHRRWFNQSMEPPWEAEAAQAQ